MKILVTGGAGFIGSQIIKFFNKNTAWEITSLDRLSYAGNQNRLVGSNARTVFHDLRAEINQEVSASLGQFDYIFHLAASSHVPNSIANPVDAVMNNVLGTCNMLNFARDQKALKRFFFFSTDEVFGSAEDGQIFDENSRYNSLNPYSATKAGAEELCHAFSNTYEIPVTAIHPSNVFGPDQHSEKFVPMVVSKIMRSEQVLIHCRDGKPAERQFIHSDDVASACKHLIQTDAQLRKVNISGEEHWDVLSLCLFIAKILGKPLDYKMVEHDPSRPNFDQKYHTSSNALAGIGWRPMISRSITNSLPDIVKQYRDDIESLSIR